MKCRIILICDNIVSKDVLPARRTKAKAEIDKNTQAILDNPSSMTSNYHQKLLRQWWRHTARRDAMKVSQESRPLHWLFASDQTPNFRFYFDNEVMPADLVQVFAFDDDYTFGILQSNFHWLWFNEKMSTLREDPRYTPTSVFNTFPFPQHPDVQRVKVIADAGSALHDYRRKEMAKSESGLNLRDMYRTLEEPGDNPLRDLHTALDEAVLDAYGFNAEDDILEQLLTLNFEVAAKIEAGEKVTSPGIPPDYPDPSELISDGCIQPPELI